MKRAEDVSSEKSLVIVLGPTAVGKTTTSVHIAQAFSTEIISVDSRQFYKEMKIGTAVPSADELAKIPHHFIGNLSIHDYYNVFKFETDAIQILNELFKNHNIVVMTGGSGLYIDTICYGIDAMPDADPEIREQLNQTFDLYGIVPLREQLRLLDFQSYSKIDIANPKRIIRALEVCISTGLPYSSLLKNNPAKRPFHIIKIGLKLDRAELYDRINRRVDQMITDGLEQEARNLFQYKNISALNTVGYRELFACFEGKCTLPEAIDKIKVNTRRYAKKQMTWFARDKEIKWFDPSALSDILNYIREQV